MSSNISLTSWRWCGCILALSFILTIRFYFRLLMVSFCPDFALLYIASIVATTCIRLGSKDDDSATILLGGKHMTLKWLQSFQSGKKWSKMHAKTTQSTLARVANFIQLQCPMSQPFSFSRLSSNQSICSIQKFLSRTWEQTFLSRTVQSAELRL